MKRLLASILLIFLALMICSPVYTQTSVNGRVVVGTLANIPAACSPGDTYVQTDSPYHVFTCGPSNTWTDRAAPAIKTNGVANSDQSQLNLINSIVNPIGLSATFSNTTGGTVKIEISGQANYPGISGTQCLHSVSGVTSGTGADCGNASVTVGALNAAVPDHTYCSPFSGADIGAQLNACIAAASAGQTLDMSGMSGVLSTAVNVNKSVTIWCGGQFVTSITQTASVTLSADKSAITGPPERPCKWNKGGNLTAQFIVTGLGSEVSFQYVNGNSSSTWTGDGVQVSSALGFNGPRIVNNLFTAELGNAVTDTGEGTLVADNDFELIIGDAINSTSFNNDQRVYRHNFYQDSSSTTGHFLNVSSGGPTLLLTENTAYGSHAVLVAAGTGGLVTITKNILQEFGGFSAITGIATIIDNPEIAGGNGGSHSPVVLVHASKISGNHISCITTDCIDTYGDSSTIVDHNLIHITSQTSAGLCGINFKGGDMLAGIAESNLITVDFGGETGANYATCITAFASGHTNQLEFRSNKAEGSASTIDCVFYFDNSAGIASFASGNTISYNVGIDMGHTICRNDSSNLANQFYLNNTGILFGSIYESGGGSTGDFITSDTDAPFTVASLPTAAQGSRVYCSDCSNLIPTTTGGQGGSVVLTRYGWALGWIGPTTSSSPASPLIVNANSTSDQLLFVGSVAANMLVSVGKKLHIHFSGIYSTAASSTSVLTFKLIGCAGQTLPCSSGTLINTFTTPALGTITVANNPIVIDETWIVQSTSFGSEAFIGTSGFLCVDLGSTTTTAASTFLDNSTAAINYGSAILNAPSYILVTVSFSAASTSNTATGLTMLVDSE